jgi:hypothetical protein
MWLNGKRIGEIAIEALQIGVFKYTAQDLVGKITLTDIVDLQTGEIVIECNEEISFDNYKVLEQLDIDELELVVNSEVDVYGLDSRNSVANSWNANYTGTVMHKFLDRSVDIQKSHQDLCYRYMRYGEIILNYAEASNELGEDAEARTYLNMIRKRAFMPEVTESGAALKLRIRNERRIELVFEGQRFFDVRRWLIGADAYHDVSAVKVVYELNPDHTTAPGHRL